MTALVTLADAGTAVGTLVLAGATFVSVRASARSTRIAERALLAGQRPVLAPAGPGDQAERIQFADGRVFAVGKQQALVEHDAGVIPGHPAVQRRSRPGAPVRLPPPR